MLHKLWKSTTLLLITFTAFLLTSTDVQSGDVLNFLVIPESPNVQAGMDVMLACENGVAFGFSTMVPMARLEDSEHVWDISFANEAGLLIQEFPLALGESTTPLHLENLKFPYRAFHTLLWSETLTEESIAICIAGAGSGFCQFRLPIDDCRIKSDIVANISQIGPGNTTPLVTDRLVYEVQTYDPAVGAANGDGIEQVELKMLDYGRGEEIFSTTLETAIDADGQVTYCAFSSACEPWDFAANGYVWPNGEPITSGLYLLRAIVTTPDGGNAVVQKEFELQLQQEPIVAALPGGEFTIGTATGTNREAPVHTVAIDDFWLMTTEVTYRQYRQCVEDYACTKPEDDTRWNDPVYAEHPVANLNWGQANDYADWVGGRLPTEAEWEAACRSEDARTYPWGSEDPSDELANFNQAVGDTTPVGSYPAGATPSGLLDMSGNVWEWTSSVYSPYPYSKDDGREDPRSAEDRTVRGGSFYYTQYQLTCSARAHFAPQTSNSQIGLRVAFDQPISMKNPQAVRITSPADGASVASPVAFDMVAEGLTVEAAGEIRPDAGHFHLLVDTEFVAAEELIPFDDKHHHFGDGSTTAMLELAPGVHTIRLQFANGAHQALDGDQFRDEITITVE